jgi:GNAT superfamily N-acetyltransferase
VIAPGAAILARMLRIERAEDEHLDGVRAIAASYGNLDEWPGRPDALDFELREGALWVALDDGAVAGYAGVVRHGEIAHLADLYVARERLGRGIGRRLLDATLPRDGVRIAFASGDERALPLYVRAGLRPLAPLLYLEGAPAAAAVESAPGAPARADQSAPAPARADQSAPAPARAALADIADRDAIASRRERPELLAFLEQAGAYALAGARPGCYAVVRPAPAGAWLGPASADAGELLALAGAVAAEHGSAKLALCGPHPALGPLLDAGFRLLGSDTYMASHPGALDMETYVPEADLG